jgi:hypothetical protein
MWPWLAVAGLGLYHGLNPAMGWLFAVALGLHRRSRRVVFLSLLPIAAGHALAVLATAAALMAAGTVVDATILRPAAGAALILWALYLLFYGRRHRTRVGMQTGYGGLALWSFIMAGAHGAGLMLFPALMPLCIDPGPAGEASRAWLLPNAVAAVGLHTAAMLLATAVAATLVYEWVGVAFLRRGWLNLDLLWIAALGATGGLLVLG